MTTKLQDKSIIVTGAASGIGRATAIKLSSQGAQLALCDLNEPALKRLTTEIPSLNAAATHAFNVGSSAECEAAVKATLEKFGKIDFLFNCAGVNPTPMPIEDTTDEYFDKLVNTNLKGPYNMTRAVVPHLKSGGTIVNVSSTAGLRASWGYQIYSATKFGIIGFTKAMALELGPKGIRVNCVAPGPTNTPTMSGNVEGGNANEKLIAGIPLGRLGQPEEVADVVAFLFSDESRYMNGSVVEVHGGMGI